MLRVLALLTKHIQGWNTDKHFWTLLHSTIIQTTSELRHCKHDSHAHNKHNVTFLIDKTDDQRSDLLTVFCKHTVMQTGHTKKTKFRYIQSINN